MSADLAAERRRRQSPTGGLAAAAPRTARRSPGAALARGDRRGAAVLAARAARARSASTPTPALRHQPPSAAHWFGTDTLGRDLLRARARRRPHVARWSASSPRSPRVAIGVLYGAVAGYYGGAVDEAHDALRRFPVRHPVHVPRHPDHADVLGDRARRAAARVRRARARAVAHDGAHRARPGAHAARRASSCWRRGPAARTAARILFRHILPKCLGPIIVYATLTVPSVIILESFLSFLGLGVKLSWGQLVAEAVAVVNPIDSSWWLLAFPSGFLAATLLALNFLGDAGRDEVGWPGPGRDAALAPRAVRVEASPARTPAGDAPCSWRGAARVSSETRGLRASPPVPDGGSALARRCAWCFDS